ncbi:MAG: Rpn family recombination-promoting nuclease/putative transposase [Spirochaetaceae bacterium]|jgi:hypothetical protein|nr:Rpn family recombination-promoting nuclease/putative transposase [Spirochaetaceae bacterium]
MAANSKYKDSVFSFLFSDADALRELYGALEGVTPPPDIPVEINTLSDVLYMGQLNDISFTIGNVLVVVMEHQSTINPNMPLRLLVYIARIYEKIVERRNLYKSVLEKIPAPEFIVLYNGTKPWPDQTALKLSDAFKDAGGLRGCVSAPLELEVKVYNINKGHNAEIARKCEKLCGYSVFVDKVREMERELPKELAMKAAIEYCVKHNVLRGFLETHGLEVMNMLITEWDTEEAKEVWYEEGLEKERETTIKSLLRFGMRHEKIAGILNLPLAVVEQYHTSPD